MDRYLIQRHLFDDSLSVIALPRGEILAKIEPWYAGYRARVGGRLLLSTPFETVERFAARVVKASIAAKAPCQEGNTATKSPSIETLPLFS